MLQKEFFVADFSSMSKEELELLLMSMKKELDDTRSELSSTITELGETKNRLNASESELDKAQNQLSVTENKLNNAEAKLSAANKYRTPLYSLIY